MASPITISNPTRENSRRNNNKKKKNINKNQTHPKWNSEAQQQIYSTKLRQALTRVNISRGKAVRDAVDRTLAVTAKGRTRWSRAILMSRLKIKFRKHRVTPKPRISVMRLKGKAVPSFQRKVRFLGRLVPGCKKEPLPVILEEAIDYIPALEMQVRAMTHLFNLLSATSSG